VLLIRPRADADLAAAVEILAEVHDRDRYPLHWPADPVRWLAAPTVVAAWVATVAGRVAGHVSLAEAGPGDAAPPRYGDAAVMLTRLFVAPAARGHGAGAALVRQAVCAAAERGLHSVLDVHVSNTAAIALYEHLGWRRIGTSHAQWGPDRVTVYSYTAPA
jgi:ribosomal protein S18 acetylase RimI-like enzyme